MPSLSYVYGVLLSNEVFYFLYQFIGKTLEKLNELHSEIMRQGRYIILYRL